MPEQALISEQYQTTGNPSPPVSVSKGTAARPSASKPYPYSLLGQAQSRSPERLTALHVIPVSDRVYGAMVRRSCSVSS